MTATMTLTDEAVCLADLKARRDDAKRTYDALNAEFAVAQTALIERMDEEGCQGVKANGINFVPAKTIYGQVQDRSEFIAWAQQNDDECIELKERAQLINQLARQHIDDGEPLPPGLGFYVKEYISQRAA